MTLGVGVIGLGRLWEARHKPALSRLTDQFRIVAVYDQVARRAAMEAHQLHCAPCEGLVQLLDRADVDVIYLTSPQWFGLHPVALACARRKPVYCALPLADRCAELEALAPLIRSSGTPFMVELARRFYPVTLRLRELLATRLGRPRLILGRNRLFGYDRYGQPGPGIQLTPAPLLIDPGSFLIDWCRFLFGNDPWDIHRTSGVVLGNGGPPGPDYESFSARFPGGGIAEIASYRYHGEAWGEASRFLPHPGFQVFAEHGAAWLEMPDRIQWTDDQGVHEERLPLEPSVGEVLNDHFHRLVRGDHTLAPSFDDALRLARMIKGLLSQDQEIPSSGMSASLVP